MKMTRRSHLFLFVLLCFALVAHSDAFFRKKKADNQTPPIVTKSSKHPRPAVIPHDIRGDLGLVGEAGHYLWTYIASCRLYIWAITGYSMDEKLTVYCVSILCNILYCLIVLVGFYFLPRDFMLVVGLFTSTIGPSLVLFVLGFIVLSIAFMAFYPMYTVACIWLFNFARSQFVQRLGLMLKLDIDGDGSVNWSDALAWAGKTKWGSRLGLNQLHDQICASRKHSLIDVIAECIERQEDKIVKHMERILSTSSLQSNGKVNSFSAQSDSKTDDYMNLREELESMLDKNFGDKNAFRTVPAPSPESTALESAWDGAEPDAARRRRLLTGASRADSIYKLQRRASLPARVPDIGSDPTRLAMLPRQGGKDGTSTEGTRTEGCPTLSSQKPDDAVPWLHRSAKGVKSPDTADGIDLCSPTENAGCVEKTTERGALLGVSGGGSQGGASRPATAGPVRSGGDAERSVGVCAT
jgi:hypothetical protein